MTCSYCNLDVPTKHNVQTCEARKKDEAMALNKPSIDISSYNSKRQKVKEFIYREYEIYDRNIFDNNVEF